MPEVSTRPPSLADIIIPQRIERLTAIENAKAGQNRLGTQIVNNYFASSNKYPGGDCTDVSWDRVTFAAAQAGVPMLALCDKGSSFGRLWYSNSEPRRTWRNLPWAYRGKGAAGAMAYMGLANLVDAGGIWAGQLQPGAVLQAWKVAADYYRVRDGDAPTNYGHSFIFLNHLHSDTAITGMRVADQGFVGDRPFVTRGEFALWFGANHNSGVRQSDLLY